jgi:Peptidase A4 family
MQNKKWQFVSRVVAVAAMTASVAGFTTSAMAQREDASAIFASAPKVATSVSGARFFAAPPKNFNPFTATNRELLTYGLPQRPDKTADPIGYDHWQRGMSALKTYVTNVKAQPFTSRDMVPAGPAPQLKEDGTTAVGSLNWSGIGQTNKNKTWSNKTSFNLVESVWNVPVANHPFGDIPCSDGPWWEVTWNGIDGYNSGDVVQGGSSSYWDGGGCNGPVQYYGWVEWYPSYSILPLYCGSSLCPVSPGDDFWVITYGAAGTASQNVFVEDITQQWSGTINLTYLSGPGVIGNVAEYIVERPCCNGDNFYPLGNYVYEFFDYSFAYDGNNTQFFPGNASAATAIFTMYADDGETPISRPFYYGTGGNQGKYSIWMADENCANSGGCTP